MIISLIAAVAENNVIGCEGSLPWHLPDDLKFFKETTLHHHIIMGRKTLDSFGKPLRNRTHIVITRQRDFQREGVQVVHGLNEALDIARSHGEEEAFVIGGGQIYREALPLADRLYITRIHQAFEGDTFFPEWKDSEWQVSQSTHHPADEKHAYPFTFLHLERIIKNS